MKIRSIILAMIISGAACRQSNTQTNSDVTLAKGQMPAITKDKNNNLHLVFGTGDSLMYTCSTDNGHTFSAPVLIKVLPGVYTYATRGPQIAATSNGIIVTACTKEGNLYAFRKPDGSGWQPGIKVNDRDTVCKEGFTALSADGSQVFAVWLDTRGNGHNKLYGAASADGGNSWSKNSLVYASPDSTICECCKPSVAVRNNKVAILFRNWLHGNRDMYLVQSADGGNTFGSAEKSGTGSWPLNGCPMDGGHLVMTSNNTIKTVWQREGTIYAASPGMPEQSLGEGRSCTLETAGDVPVYAWVENGRIVVRKPDGKKESAGNGSLPVLQSVNNKQVLCVWEQDKQIHALVIPL